MPVSPAERKARRERRRAFAPDPVPLVFVGGTGRSGTHVVARLLGRSEHYSSIPVECRFHTDADGFPGLLAGEVSKRQFLRRLRGFWWRGFQTNRLRGLHRLLPREHLDAAAEAFDAAFDADPREACRGLFWELLGPLAETGGGLVEQSCDVVARAPVLAELFPEARFVHVVRDGRDASASRVAQTRGLIRPRTRSQGLEWWEGRIRAIDAGARAIPGGRFHELELGALLAGRRRRTLRELAHFAGIRPEPRMKRFVHKRMSRGAAHEERWRRGLSAPAQERLDRAYGDALERLERDGVSCVPLLRHAHRRSKRIEASGDDE